MTEFTMPTYKRLAVRFTHGSGPYLWDEAGRRYLDALSGVAVCGLGHAHPAIAAAICEQAGKLLHTSNLYGVTLQEELARRLLDKSGLRAAFFCNSGAEANEAAIKLARKRGADRGIATPTIIVTERSFHGRTLATLSATGNAKIQAGFAPLLPGFVHVPFDDVAAIERVLASRHDVVALLVEPVQGEGGINVPAADYLPRLRALCDEHGLLLMLDEVQTGMCRSGRWFAYQHHAITPDVMTLAKGLGNGFPIGACLAGERAAGVFGPGNHGSTFGGSPLASRVALTVLDVLEQGDYAVRAAALGTRMLGALRQQLGQVLGVVSVRGLGLLLGIELDRPCAAIVEQALAAGLLLNVTGERVIRLLPPLVITDAEADDIVASVVGLTRRWLEG
ncbi:MAG: aspartate aminotransferase family protein [Gammaproteobacteria bacterium]|nr:aspartate aminotransferase family protein [Gammaproteobacteria bacterium]